MKSWQLQQAKAHLSEIVKKVDIEGPQSVTVRGKLAVVIISIHDYKKFMVEPKPSFVEFMRNSPLKGAALDLQRDKSLCRNDEDSGL